MEFECGSCGKVTEDVDYCFGCDEYLCYECDHIEDQSLSVVNISTLAGRVIVYNLSTGRAPCG